WMYTGATATRNIGWHIFETLFTLDSQYKVKPMIAKNYEINDKGTVYTISIREDVNFHDGTTVTAEDVSASIKRWEKVSSVGKIASNYIDEVNTPNKYTIEI